MKKAIKVNNQTIIGVPKQWVRPSSPEHTTLGYHTLPDTEHFADGWKEVITPVYNSSIEKLGELVEYPDRFEYSVQPLTDEEIQSRIISNAQSEQQALIQQKLEVQVLDEAQTLDDNEALENQALYPLWQDFEEEHLFPAGIKIQDFVNNELKLFKAIQPNNKRENTRPIGYPAGWTLIEFSGGVEIWSQPIGGDGKYPYIDPLTGNPYLVEHNGQTWQNTYQGGLNVWEPGVFGWEPYNP